MNSLLSLEPFIYPLKGFIKFEVDDIETLEEGPRFSKSVKVGKSEWSIGVRMECSNCTKNVACLIVYLWNFYDLDWGKCVEAKFTSRLVHGDAQKTIMKTVCGPITYYEVNYGWKLRLPIEKRERILNGGYVKDGKITIECDFDVLSETITYDELNFGESRPNDKDLKTMLSVVDFEEKKKTFELDFGTDEILEAITFSHNVYIDEVPCKIGVYGNSWDLFVCLYCNSDDRSEWWGVEATAEIKIKNRNDSTKIMSDSFLPGIFSTRSVDRRVIFSWDEIMRNGYVKYGRICIEVTVSFWNKYGFDETTGKGIEKPMKKMTDGVIEIEKEKDMEFHVEFVEFHVSRMILSHRSPWFRELFYNNPEKNKFQILDVGWSELEMFLQLAHNKKPHLDEENVWELLKLVDKYGAQEFRTRLDLQMVEICDWNDMWMLQLIDEYRLPKTKAKYAKKLQDPRQLREIFEHPDVGKLSVELRKALMSGNIPQEEEEDDNKPFYVYSKPAEITGKITDPREKIQAHFQENPDAKKLLEDPELQNVSNSFLTLLSELPSGTSNACQTSFKEFSDPSDMVTINFKDNKIFYSKENYEVLLSLGHRFLVTDVLNKCEDYLIISDKMTVNKKEAYAKKYGLKYLSSACKNYKEKK